MAGSLTCSQEKEASHKKNTLCMTPDRRFKTKQKLIYCIIAWDNGYSREAVSGKVHKGGFWGAANAIP